MTKRNKYLFIGCCLAQFLVGVHAYGQNTVSGFENALSSLRKECFSSKSTNTGSQSFSISPYYYRLLGPATYYSSTLKDLFSINPARSADGYTDNLNSEINRHLINAYLNHPNAFEHYDKQFAEENIVNESESKDNKNLTSDVNNTLGTDLKAPVIDDVVEDIGDIGLKVERPNFWKTSGKFGLQFTQNYFSENWYKGGNNNQTLLASLILQANYNDQRKVSWDNKLEMRLGFVTTTSDTCHTFLTNNDKLNLYSKLGIKATKSWYYTATAEANTQFMPGYRTNDRRTYSNFLAPLDFYLSIGMDFKPELKNGNKFSAALLPLSFKLRYIGSDDANIHKAYNMVDEDLTKDFGAKVEINSYLNLTKNISWKSRFYFFSSYKYVESEWENTLSFAFNKYISTELYTLWRFDDNRSRDFYDRNLGYFQFKEYFTLGLTYQF